MKKLLATGLLFGASAVFASPFIIQKIEVKGVQPYAEEALLSSIPDQIGKKATKQDIANIIEILSKKGYEQVTAIRDGGTLVLSVKPQYVLANVIIDGCSLIPKEAIEEQLHLISTGKDLTKMAKKNDKNKVSQLTLLSSNSKNKNKPKQVLSKKGLEKGSIIDENKLELFRAHLHSMYDSVGLYNATVKTEVEPLSEGRANLKIIIDEGEPATLESITFKGNNSYSADELESIMKQSPDAWWKIFGARFIPSEMGGDIETLTNFYHNHGYAKMYVSNLEDGLNSDKTKANVVISIDEGEQYFVTNARIVGDVGGDANQLSQALEFIHLGQLYTKSDVITVENKIKHLLGENGYANATVETSSDIDDKTKTVKLTFVVDAGHRYSVRRISFAGNTITADSTLRQEMRQQEGSWLSSQKLANGKARLERTGFFETVDYELANVPNASDQVDVIYTVKSRKTGSANFGVGFGTESGFSYNASIKQDNFLGLGSSLSLSGSRDDYSTNISLGYNEPYFTKDGVSLGGSVYFEDYDNSKSDTSSKYAKTSYGVNGTLGFPVNENNSYYLGLGYANNKLKNVEPEYQRWLYKESMNFNDWTFKTQDYDFSFGWNYNSLNRGFFPTDGVRASIGGRITLPISDNKYYKLNADIQAYHPLDREHRWVLRGNASLSYANGFGGKRLPFYKNYSAGGIGSLRGFEYGSIGPKAIYLAKTDSGEVHPNANPNNPLHYTDVSQDVVGGNAMALASIELIVPTPFVPVTSQTSVRTSLFVDAASVWSTEWKKDGKRFTNLPDYGDPSRVRASTGVALQWNSPIGPLVFSYAKPLKKYEGDQVEQFQFSVGASF